MKRALFILLLLFIFFIGSYQRISGIASNSFAFTYDVGRDMLALQQIVYHHKIPLIGFTTGVEGIFYGPWWYYILAFPFALSGGNPQFIAYFIALTGITAIILLFVFGKKIGSQFLGVTLALLCAVSPVMIGLSNQIWNPNIAPILIVFSLLIINRLLKQQDRWSYFLFGLTSGLIVEAEVVFGLLLLVAYNVSLIILLRKTVFAKKITFYFLGIFIIFLPRVLFEFRHQFLMTKTIITLLTHPASAGPTLPTGNKLLIFFGQFAGTLTNGQQFPAIFLLLLLTLSFMRYRTKIKNPERFFFYFSCITVGVFIIGIFFFRHDIWPHYLVGLPVFYILATGILFNAVHIHTKNYVRFIPVLLLVLLFWINVNPVAVLGNINKPVFAGDAAVYRNQLAVVDYIYSNAHGQPFNYVAYSPAVYDYPYQYLFSWYGKNKYHYMPSSGKQKLFFLIIEPDFQHPSLLRDWLTLREHDGIVVSQRVVKGGVVVQTRIH